MLIFGAFFFSTPSNAVCRIPSFLNSDPIEKAAYELCMQQERALRQQQEQIFRQQQQMQMQQMEMELQRREMERQTVIQQQQLEIQKRQLQLQRQEMVSSVQRDQSPLQPGLPASSYFLNTIVPMIADFNRSLPRKIDDITEVFRVDANDNVITYNLRVQSANISPNEYAVLVTNINQNACRDELMMQNIKSYGIKYVYRYFTESGSIHDILIQNLNC